MKVTARAIIPAFNNFAALQGWLRPGFASFVIGAHIDALRTIAVRLQTEHAGILDECALKYPDVYPDDWDVEEERGTPHPKAGQHVTFVGSNGVTLTQFRDEAAQQDYATREKALMDADVEVAIDDEARLTVALLQKLDTERLPKPRPVNGLATASDDMPGVDFAALMPFVLRNAPGNGAAARTPAAPVAPVAAH